MNRFLGLIFALATLAARGRCDADSTLTSLVEDRFNKDTEYCKKSAQDTHGNSVDPTRELNHFLLCLSKKTETEVSGFEKPISTRDRIK